MQGSPEAPKPVPSVVREMRRDAMRLEAVVAFILLLAIVTLIYAFAVDAPLAARGAA
jgi:hypothetical protein